MMLLNGICLQGLWIYKQLNRQLNTPRTSAYLSDDSPVSNLIGILNLLLGELTLTPRRFVYALYFSSGYSGGAPAVLLLLRDARVNAVSPGVISTPMLSAQGMGLSDEQVAQFEKTALTMVPLGRLGNPDEIAKAVAFLASDDSSYITGIELFVDGV